MEVEMQTLTDFLTHPSEMLESLNYNVIERIGDGRGRFRAVYKCLKRDTNLIVAIKVFSILEEELNEGVPSLIIREISVLKELEHPNIVRLLDVLNMDCDIFLAFEHVDLDLGEFIKNQTITKNALQVKKFLHQMLSAIEYLHDHNILLRYLKPQNVLVYPTDNIVKLADFGSDKDYGDSPFLTSTSEVGPLCYSYRAPEILLAATEYSTTSGMWSVGCIFAEMVIGRALFTATSELEAFRVIFSLLGTPTEETWPGITSLCEFMYLFDPTTRPKDLALEFPTLEPAGVDLLSKMLCVYPNNRISAEDALEHEFFNGIEMVQ